MTGNRILALSRWAETTLLILVTEWNEFRNPDFNKMKDLLKDPVIFDGRNQYSRREMRELGFDYVGVGRPQTADS